MVIIETPIFTKQIQDVMEDNDYAALQESLSINPASGDLIKGTGGLRKIRWAASGKGKRGGARIIYYWLTDDDQIFMLFAYPKNQQIDLTEAQKKILMHLVHEELSK
jgi:mRNA-degrading endonuclease RelE of RelBE toxin-antitoxin system